MALNVPVFFTRLGSSVVFVAIMLTGLLWNEWSFLGLVCLINILCLREYFPLMKKIFPDNYWPQWLPVILQVLSVAAMLSVASGSSDAEINFPYYSAVAYISCFIPVVLILSAVLSKKVYVNAAFQSVGGLLYITTAMIMFFFIRTQGVYLPLILIVMIWSNDTMAYLVGSFFGKTPFSPISPKKTWEGTAGGAIITIIAAGVVGYITHTYRIIDWMALALCATIAGTLGDLLESKLKRMADVKDSGTMMPGHGGALDRFDSLLVATPFAFAYVMLFMH